MYIAPIYLKDILGHITRDTQVCIYDCYSDDNPVLYTGDAYNAINNLTDYLRMRISDIEIDDGILYIPTYIDFVELHNRDIF